MSWTHIAAPAGPVDPLLEVVREIGAEALVVLGDEPAIAPLEEVMGPMGIPVDVREVHGPPILGTVAAVERTLEDRTTAREELIVNLAGADRWGSFGLVTAAFAIGLPAARATDGRIERLPRLRFGCQTRLGPDEWRVLAGFDRLEEPTAGATLERLAEVSGLSRAEISYRVRGGDRCAGLEPMGLVTAEQVDGSIHLALTPVGGAYLETLSAQRWLEPRPSGRYHDGRPRASTP